MCNRPVDRYPDYTWIFTKAGKEAFHIWYTEQLKRDQDIYDINVNGDFPGWAITEVMENQVCPAGLLHHGLLTRFWKACRI